MSTTMSQQSNSNAGRIAKHEMVAATLREEILHGSLSVGEKLASESELCDRFRISRGPIRQALATLEQESLIYRVQGMGSFVADRAASLTGRREVRRIKIVTDFPSSAGGFALKIIDGLSKAARELHPRIRLSFEFGFDHLDRFAHSTEADLKAECDGLLILPVETAGIERVRHLQVRHIPMISCFGYVDVPQLDQIYVDQQAGAFRATEYLLRYGHKRVALITAASQNATPRFDTHQRVAGYVDAHQTCQVPIDRSLLIETSWALDVAAEATTELLQRDDRPTAIMIGGLMLQSPCLYAIRQTGLKVPDDLSIIAFDDSPESQHFTPPITVVRQRADRAADLALKRLLAQIEGTTSDSICEGIKPELVVRDSCRAL